MLEKHSKTSGGGIEECITLMTSGKNGTLGKFKVIGILEKGTFEKFGGIKEFMKSKKSGSLERFRGKDNHVIWKNGTFKDFGRTFVVSTAHS